MIGVYVREAFRALLLVLSVCMIFGCDGSKTPPAQSKKETPSVVVSLAPFDRFPDHGKFPLLFRFSEPVAPAFRTSASNFEAITITPHINGWWTWLSDSDLRFEPTDPWRPKQAFTVDLTGLITVGKNYGSTVPFSPVKFPIILPTPSAHVARCEFTLKNKAPVIQAPHILLRINYAPNSLELSKFIEAKLLTEGKEEALSFTSVASSTSTAVDLMGPQLFRPHAPGKVQFRLKAGLPLLPEGVLEQGTECDLPLDPDTWDAALDAAQEKIAKPLLNLSATIPSRTPGSLLPNKEALQLTFAEAASGRWTPHGKAKGLALREGITLSPEITGEWRTDEYSDTKLFFVPSHDWPVGTTLRITLDPELFPELNLKTSTVEVRTPPLMLELSNAALYSDPHDPKVRQITAEITSSHPLDEAQLGSSISLRLRIEPEKNFHGPGSSILKFSLVRDEKNSLRLYLKSDPFPLPLEPGEALISVAKGILSTRGGAPSDFNYGANIPVPSSREVFRVVSSDLTVVTKKDSSGERMERILSIEMSDPIEPAQLLASMQALLLPDCNLEKNVNVCREQEEFGQEEAVLPEALKESSSLSLALVPRDESTLPNLHLFSLSTPENREILLSIKEGTVSRNGFPLAKEYRRVLFSQQLPKSLKILHEGSLLSLSGSKKLGVTARNVGEIEYELARILPSNVPHLVSVTSGNFATPDFNMASIALDQLSERFNYSEAFPGREPGTTIYSAVDFDRFLSKGASPRGLFMLTVKEKQNNEQGDSSEEHSYEEECYEDECSESDTSPAFDARLVLLTDLGLLVKDSLSGEHQVFVMSFRTGSPVAGASVKLLGQNGIAIFTATTDSEGKAQFPRTNELKREKIPLLYSVEKDGDFSFLPFRRYDRLLNVSRFETSGVMNSQEADGLRALLFSDRGIYRPGEEGRFGIIVRKRNLEPAAEDLPLEIGLTDPRGIEILRKKFSLSRLGFEEFRWSTEGVLTGTYTLGVYLVRDRKNRDVPLLGSTTFRVDEFQPDKLAIKTSYLTEDGSAPSGLNWRGRKGSFHVEVANLFGISAVENKVKGSLLVRPWDGALPGFPEFRFYARSSTEELPQSPEDLGEVLTDEKGNAVFSPDLTRFAEDAFWIDFAAEAFEKDSGRGVVSSLSTLVSDAPWFLGWKADGSLGYIAQGSARALTLKALNPDLSPRELHDIRVELEETKNISALVKQPNGTLQYELTPKKSIIWNGTLNIGEEGAAFPLSTNTAGSFTLRFFDSSGKVCGAVPYLVMGEGNSTFLTDRSVEVGIRLNKNSVEPDEELEISLNTPYAGSGLITIERDKVYASQWFKSDTNASVHKLRVPRGIIGNAYVAVTFVRSLSSKDIYAPPLSFGVRPFSIARSQYTADIQLTTPDKVRPGTSLPVEYQLSAPGKLLVYAVDEGILQFARYKTPDPVTSFVPKRALEVETYQILDLLLPDYKIVEELSSPGGDEDVGLGKFKNPFARKRRPPMAFWSGIIDAANTRGKVEIPVPEYFNGTIRILALVVADKKLGIIASKTISQADFIIDPQLPYFVSPGDEFEVGATVANALPGSGKEAKIALKVLPSEGLTLVSNEALELTVPEGQDKSFRVRLKAGDLLGEKSIRIEASAAGAQAGASDTLSLRPPRVFRTEIQAGVHEPKKDSSGERTLSLTRNLFSDMREVQASISRSPLSIGRSLIGYLKQYPYGCTEQLVSTAFPAVIFGQDTELGLNAEDAKRLTSRVFRALSMRQLADGSFGVWDASSGSDPLFSVYAAHFLEESRDRGFEIPSIVSDRARAWLSRLGATPAYEPIAQLAQAYALYVRARSGEVVTNEAKALVAELDRQWQQKWRSTSTALFLAGTFKLLQLDSEAQALLAAPPRIWKSSFGWPLSDPAFYGSLYAYISARHFSQEFWLSPLDGARAVSYMIESKDFNSFNASFALMGLHALGEALKGADSTALSILGGEAQNNKLALTLEGTKILHTLIPEPVRSLIFKGDKDTLFFYELSESGFDRSPPAEKEEGLRIEREFKDQNGAAVSQIALTDKLEVTLFIKPEEALERVAVVELIPGGFEIDLSEQGLAQRKSLNPGPNSWAPTFIDIQEDRIIFFGNLRDDTQTFTYRLKPLARGTFIMPAAYAEAMYDAKKRFIGKESVIEVK